MQIHMRLYLNIGTHSPNNFTVYHNQVNDTWVDLFMLWYSNFIVIEMLPDSTIFNGKLFRHHTVYFSIVFNKVYNVIVYWHMCLNNKQFWIFTIHRILILHKVYSLVVNKRPLPRLLIFGKFSHPPELVWTPRLLIQEDFCFSNYKIFKSLLSIRGNLTNISVPELYWCRKRKNKLKYIHKEHNLIPYL